MILNGKEYNDAELVQLEQAYKAAFTNELVVDDLKGFCQVGDTDFFGSSLTDGQLRYRAALNDVFKYISSMADL